MTRDRKTEKATFAAGCFWHVEDTFRKLPGVVSTMVGYTGGKTVNPCYEEVCSNTTGHAEAVYMEYDPQEITYEDLLNTFWQVHDPTQLNRQGPDIGSQYRSAIFYHTPEQKEQAWRSRERLMQSRKYEHPIVTEIAPAEIFYKAEEYHQQYLERRRMARLPQS